MQNKGCLVCFCQLPVCARFEGDSNLEPTKRNVVGVTAKFYNPMGFLSPIIKEFKMFFQDLCRAKPDWL